MQPSELVVSKDRRELTISFKDGAQFQLSAEALRVFSPSAEVQGHSPQQRKLIGGKKQVGIMEMEPVGNYAVRITFDDMHNTGIFSWKWLRELGETYDEKWSAYLLELDQKGISRDPVIRRSGEE